MKSVNIVHSQPHLTERQTSVPVTPRVLGILGLLSIIIIHWLDLPGKLSEVPYLGYAYIALMVGSALAAVLLVQDDKRGWWLGGLLALGAIIAYTLTRTVGLPLATDDIGNWGESLGVYSLVAEGLMVLLSSWVLSRRDVRVTR